MGSRILLTIIAALVIGLIQFVVGLTANGGAILVCGALMGLLSYALWEMRRAADKSPADLYLPLLATVIGIASGGMLSREMRSPNGFSTISPADSGYIEFWSILLGLVLAGGVIAWRLRKRAERCQVCRKPLAGSLLAPKLLGTTFQDCPRCGNSVCLNCWIADSFRCVVCERARTPLLSIEEDEWWSERLGNRQSVGRCVRCQRQANERDLRKCGNCPRAMCVHCWDMENGRCVGCDWVIPHLPRSLASYHAYHARMGEE